MKPTPHDYKRNSAVIKLLLIIAAAIVIAFNIHCSTPKRSINMPLRCPTVTEAQKSSRYGYTYNPKSGLVLILDRRGAILCSYYTKKYVKAYMNRI